MADFGKAPGLQLLLRLSYAGNRFFGVAPQREGPCVLHAVLARLHRGGIVSVPYALNFAARTDRGVDAAENWLSFRLRLPLVGPAAHRGVSAALEALEDDSGLVSDGLTGVRVCEVPQRIMARNLVVAKHYRYLLPGAAGAAALGGQAPFVVMQEAAAALSGQVHIGRLAHPKAARAVGAALRRPMWVTVSEAHGGGFVVDVLGQGFVRRQVRYCVGALQAVQRRMWAPTDVLHLTAGHLGPERPGFMGPAAAEGLTLQALWPYAWAAPLVAPCTFGGAQSPSAPLFAAWLSGPCAP